VRFKHGPSGEGVVATTIYINQRCAGEGTRKIGCRFTLKLTFFLKKQKLQRSPRLADIVNKSGTAGESNPGVGSGVGKWSPLGQPLLKILVEPKNQM
jgi:hypothetical protein